MHRLSNVIHDYAWGSTSEIPRFLGIPETGQPFAEVWMGTHQRGMSTADGRPLTDVIGGPLPFMLKILAPAQPLSIQVHPRAVDAQRGFVAEESAGIPLDAKNRCYPDQFAKYEMVYALTEFDTLVGLRREAEVLSIFDALATPLAARFAARLRAAGGFAGVVELISEVLAGGVDEAALAEFVARAEALRGADIGRAFETIAETARFHPGDPGVIVATLLNRMTLQPGEAAVFAPGLIHAHLSGLCLEVMVSSDNVLRAGLTPKHVDVAAVVACLTDDTADPIVKAQPVGDTSTVFAPVSGGFALAVTRGSTAGEPVPGSGDRIVLGIDGDVELASAAGQLFRLTRGQSVYVASEDGTLTVRGAGTVAQACYAL